MLCAEAVKEQLHEHEAYIVSVFIQLSRPNHSFAASWRLRIRASLKCKVRTDALLPPSVHNTFQACECMSTRSTHCTLACMSFAHAQSTVSPFDVDLWAEISG